MECQDIKDLLLSYMEGDLNTAQNQAVCQHLKHCLFCRQELLIYEKSWSLLDKWTDLDPEPGYVSRFWNRLEEQKPWYVQCKEWFKGAVMDQHWIPVGVTVCIVLMVGILTYRSTFSANSTPSLLANLSVEDMELLLDYDLVEDYEIVQDLGFLEDWDVIETMEGSHHS
jgi:predicted anti-sigma-YlaC factor YlaD